jgi:hypothetical protein
VAGGDVLPSRRLLARVTGNQPHENNWLEVKSGAAE